MTGQLTGLASGGITAKTGGNDIWVIHKLMDHFVETWQCYKGHTETPLPLFFVNQAIFAGLQKSAYSKHSLKFPIIVLLEFTISNSPPLPYPSLPRALIAQKKQTLITQMKHNLSLKYNFEN